MALVTLSDALDRALSDKELIGEAIGVALAREKAPTEAGTKVGVSFSEVRNSVTDWIEAGEPAVIQSVTMPTMDMDGRVAPQSRQPRLATRQPMLRVVIGGRRDGGGARSPAVQRSPREGKARRTVLRVVPS